VSEERIEAWSFGGRVVPREPGAQTFENAFGETEFLARLRRCWTVRFGDGELSSIAWVLRTEARRACREWKPYGARRVVRVDIRHQRGSKP